MLYLDTANIDELKKAMQLNILNGVTTNPSILLKEGKQREEMIQEILSVTTGEVFVQTEGMTVEEICKDAETILNTFQSDRIALKIPAHFEGIQAISKMKDTYPNVNVLATAIYSAEQGLLAALAGCEYIAPYVNRMENNNINPYEVIANIHQIFNDQQIQTKILAASFKNTNQIVHILAAGAHTATISFELFEAMANKGLAIEAIEKFNSDAAKLRSLRGHTNA
ncbi:transaldolase family protein [Pseudogracilibacillus sp. SE30717A]|uniref:transaldolase family protein n=1 Tax=Pseudogracilibacillus sp. SE30717A TaxID=3098293 RepID=UPI00300E6316